MAEIWFSASGERLSAFRDALRRDGIPCTAQQLRGNCFYAQTAVRNERRLQQLAEMYDVTLTVLKRRGLRYLLKPYCKRIGILCGLLCGAAFLWWCNATVRSIEISGNETVSDAEILTALAELGVTYGTPLRDLPYTYIEQRMRLSVREIEWIALRHTGGRLIVEMTEERQPPQLADKRVPTNYIAAVPAQITEMDVRGGHAVKQVGDAVKAGDLLITGVQADRYGMTRYFHADGIVRGIYQAEFTQAQPFVAELPVRGESVTETVLALFGKRISLSPGFEPPAHPESIIYEEDADRLTVFGKAFPLTLLHCRYTRQETAISVFSREEAQAILEESALRYEQNFHADDTVLSREAEFFETDLGISLKINYVFEGVIGKTSEIFVKLS